MKLRNKLTGKINIVKVDEDYFNIYKDDGEFVCPVTLKELNDGWETYYEEPKSWWYIDCNGEVFRGENADKVHTDEHKSIGNYYTSSKEAKKAVEKLKAWKRLKDKGFCFCGTDCINKNNVIYFEFGERPLEQEEVGDVEKGLDLLFGGEE